MKYSELKTVLQPEDRVIFRIFSDSSTVIDSGAVVLFNVSGLDAADVITVYVEACIQHIDLRLPLDAFNAANWEQIFGKSVFEERDGDRPFAAENEELGVEPVDGPLE